MPDITFIVTVKADGIGTKGGRNELGLAKGPGIGAKNGFWINLVFFAEHQKGDELFSEKLRSSRVGVKQGVQRLEDIIPALVGAIPGFNTPNGDDDFPINAEFFFYSVKELFILAKFFFAGGYFLFGEKEWCIFVIGSGLPLFVHQFKNTTRYSLVLEDGVELLVGKVIFAFQLVKEVLVFFLCQIN